MFKVYLAGPITGISYGASVDWRQYAKDRFHDATIELRDRGQEIVGYSPMRGKLYLKNEGIIEDGKYEQTILSNDHSIVARDSNDCFTCDAILVNLLGAKQVSIGTMLEVGMCYATKRPIVLVMEPATVARETGIVVPSPYKNIHEHGMLRDMAGWRCETLNSGLETVMRVLLP